MRQLPVLALLATSWAGLCSAQEDPLADLARIEAHVCLFGEEMQMVTLRRTEPGRLEGLGSWADWQISEGDGRIALLRDGDILQINGPDSVLAAEGSVVPGHCLDATDNLRPVVAVLLGADPAATSETLRHGASLLDRVEHLEVERARLMLELADREAHIRSLEIANAAPGSLLTPAERNALRLAVQGCWVVDPGSQAGRTAVTVAFELDEDGRLAGDVRLVRYNGRSAEAAASAFEAARRAILRCRGDGYPLPSDRYEYWRRQELSFNPEQMVIR